jgi:hypothetical protein
VNWESYSFPQQKYVLAEEKREARVALLNSACFCKTNSIQNFIKVTFQFHKTGEVLVATRGMKVKIGSAPNLHFQV